MQNPTKRKLGVTEAEPHPKPKRKRSVPEKLDEFTVLEDANGDEWIIGQPIGTGGFGVIYSASRWGEHSFNYAVKCEPFNGMLTTEKNFYQINGQRADIEKFKSQRGLPSLGMPHMIASGCMSVNDLKHNFLVMPRYGKDLTRVFIENKGMLPADGVYRVAVQMLDVYEYLHSRGYVHADLKGANILMGLRGEGSRVQQAYLVDFGLSGRYTVRSDHKVRHRGTVEYMSRDAHKGVMTRRGDLEILGYNLIKWLGGKLLWVREDLVKYPKKVLCLKEAFMRNITGELAKMFEDPVPSSLVAYFAAVEEIGPDELPDYAKLRKMFEDSLAAMGLPQRDYINLSMASAVSNTRMAMRMQAADEVNATDSDQPDETVIAPGAKRPANGPPLQN